MFLVLAVLLKSVEQSQSGFESMRSDVWMIFIIGVSSVVSTLPLDTYVVFQLENKLGAEDQQLCVAPVALCVEV